MKLDLDLFRKLPLELQNYIYSFKKYFYFSKHIKELKTISRTVEPVSHQHNTCRGLIQYRFSKDHLKQNLKQKNKFIYFFTF